VAESASLIDLETCLWQQRIAAARQLAPGLSSATFSPLSAHASATKA